MEVRSALITGFRNDNWEKAWQRTKSKDPRKHNEKDVEIHENEPEKNL